MYTSLSQKAGGFLVQEEGEVAPSFIKKALACSPGLVDVQGPFCTLKRGGCFKKGGCGIPFRERLEGLCREGMQREKGDKK